LYFFISEPQYKEDCSGHGRHLLSKCRCDRLYYGPRCQYRDECNDDIDCGERGKCVDVEATTAPRHQCYCEMGWFGPGCKQRSAVKSPDLNFASYTKKQLSPTFALYWRVLREAGEIEIAMQVWPHFFTTFTHYPRALRMIFSHFVYWEARRQFYIHKREGRKSRLLLAPDGDKFNENVFAGYKPRCARTSRSKFVD
jgi:hypothetical protein